MFDGLSLLAWVGGLTILAITWFIACAISAEQIGEHHPDGFGSLDLKDRGM